MIFILDIPALVAALLTAAIASMTGYFLFLRGGLLYANAVSHAVLPGIVVAALLSHTLSPMVILLGAFGSALLALAMSEFLQNRTILNAQGAMGVALTVFFAGGVFMLERLDLSHFHIDVEHALYGNLEGVVWYSLASDGLLSRTTFLTMPYEIPLLFMVFMVLAFILLRYRHYFVLVSFDPIYARAVGVDVVFWHRALAFLTSFAVAACFQATGAVLTIALFAAPVATAFILGGDMMTQLRSSLFIAMNAVFIGYGVAVYLPLIFGERAFNAGGSIATIAGIILLATVAIERKKGVAMRTKKR